MNYIETSIDLERHLAVAQIKYYLHLQQSAIAVGDKDEYRRATDCIDRLTTKNGVGALRQAQEGLL